MKNPSIKFHLKNAFGDLRFMVSLFLVSGVLTLLTINVRAGGPLLTGANGQPVLWSRTPVQGGALNSQTVDGQGRVLYRVDSGTLGSLSNEKAVALVDRIFGEYSAIPTSTIKFVNAGPIRNPNTGQPMDVTSSNIGLISGNTPTFQNPIVFDSNGAITGSGGVLGFFNFIDVDVSNNTLKEGIVVL